MKVLPFKEKVLPFVSHFVKEMAYELCFVVHANNPKLKRKYDVHTLIRAITNRTTSSIDLILKRK